MGYGIAVVLGYLLGCSNMAFFLAKRNHADLRSGGSGNLGASNAVVLLGWKAGVLTAVHDIGKSILAVLLAGWLFPGLEYAGVAAGVASVLGHIFPFYLKFRGGKGFASYFGMTLALNWKLALCVGIAIVVVTIVTDYIVCGTLTTIITVPVYMFFTSGLFAAAILCIATAVIFWKHRENYPRMLNGTELGLRSALKGENKIR
nr:glycerol-3-phosphate acyltransferase [Oscillospiraceae bacterium]